MYQLKEKDCPSDIMTIMLKAFDRCSMKGCSMEPGAEPGNYRSFSFSNHHTFSSFQIPT